jgi:hypothetical protein
MVSISKKWQVIRAYISEVWCPAITEETLKICKTTSLIVFSIPVGTLPCLNSQVWPD